MGKYDLKPIALLHGLQDQILSRRELIRKIQSKEGNFDCFATALSGQCDQDVCFWREECFDSAIVKDVKKHPHNF